MPDDTTTPTDTTEIAQVNSLSGMITKAAAALARATTSAEVLDAAAYAIVAYDAARLASRLAKAKQAHAEIIAACHKAQADALEIEAQAQCRLADEYDAAQARGEIATHSAGNPQIIQNTDDLPRTAAEVSLSNKIVHEARKVRDAERDNPGIVSRTLGEQLRKGEAPTRADIKRAIAPRRATPSNTVAPEPAAADGEEEADAVQSVDDPVFETHLGGQVYVARYPDGDIRLSCMVDAIFLNANQLRNLLDWIERIGQRLASEGER